MILKSFVTGMLENNNYLLIDEKSKEAVLFDCTEYLPEVKDILNEFDAKLKYVLITHGHFDHILGINELHQNFPDTKVYAYKDEKDLIEDVSTFVDRFLGGMGKIEVPKIDKYIDENEKIFIGDNQIKTILSPGHTKGGVCYLIHDKLFSGDTIFLGSVGRTDLPGGSYSDLKKSVKTILDSLDDSVQIFPGHSDVTTVGYEKENNPVYK